MGTNRDNKSPPKQTKQIRNSRPKQTSQNAEHSETTQSTQKRHREAKQQIRRQTTAVRVVRVYRRGRNVQYRWGGGGRSSRQRRDNGNGNGRRNQTIINETAAAVREANKTAHGNRDNEKEKMRGKRRDGRWAVDGSGGLGGEQRVTDEEKPTTNGATAADRETPVERHRYRDTGRETQRETQGEKEGSHGQTATGVGGVWGIRQRWRWATTRSGARGTRCGELGRRLGTIAIAIATGRGRHDDENQTRHTGPRGAVGRGCGREKRGKRIRRRAGRQRTNEDCDCDCD